MKNVALNVLTYAIHRDAVHHDTVRQWWERAMGGDEPIGLPWVVLLGFLRIATSPHVFPRPLTADQAIQRLDAWPAKTGGSLLSTDLEVQMTAVAIKRGAKLIRPGRTCQLSCCCP